MNIVTVFDYNLDVLNNRAMLQMFISSIVENCNKHPCTIWIITSQQNRINQIFNESFIKTIKHRPNNRSIPDKMPNIKNKLYDLCNLDFDFIYLDSDMYINADLNFIWEKRKDKPFISTMHQRDIKGHTEEKNNFMNSGLQIVSDPSFLDYDNLYDLAVKMNFKFDNPGTDQALLDSYCRQLGYNFTHPDVGCEWNSCAGYGVVDIDDEYNFDIRYKNKDIEYPVKINHYWDEFKPWVINCPIFKFYKGLV
jgi:hypothetical protein